MINYRPSWLDSDLEMCRDTVCRFIDKEMAPLDEEARERSNVGHELWLEALATITKVTRSFVDACMEALISGALDAATVSIAKVWASEQQGKVVDECLQLHGGYGFINECLIVRMYADARVQRIYGGTSEMMKEVISRRSRIWGSV